MVDSCCCFSLRTAGYIVGYFGLTINILSLIQTTHEAIQAYTTADGSGSSEVLSSSVVLSLAIGLFINGFLVYGVHKVSFVKYLVNDNFFKNSNIETEIVLPIRLLKKFTYAKSFGHNLMGISYSV